MNDELLAKYLTGNASDEEVDEVERELANNRNTQHDLQVFRQFLNAPGSSDYPDFEKYKEADWQQLTSTIRAAANVKVRPLMILTRVAASFLFLIGLSYLIFYLLHVDSPVILKANAHEVRVDTLRDGSIITLNKGASLEIEENFGEGDRRVILKGEGFFKVAKDSHRPFIVSVHTIETTVLGTEFNIDARDTSHLVVVVAEGKVRVRDANGNTETLVKSDALLAGSSIRGKYVNRDFNYQAWRTGVIKFENASLKEAFEYINRYYQSSIQLDTAIENRTITTTLDNLTLLEAVNVISRTMDLEYSNEDGIITVTQTSRVIK